MARSDGCVIINTHLNDKEAVDELDRLTKKIDALNEKISDKKQEQMPLVEQSKQIAANLDAAKGARANSKSSSKRVGFRAEQS